MTFRFNKFKAIMAYGALLSSAVLMLTAFDWLMLRPRTPTDLLLVCLALGFLALGTRMGHRLSQPVVAKSGDGNPQAVMALGLSPRELAVLREMAIGHSNKEIAHRLSVSPNTVKWHVGRVLEKLEASRRTDAIHKARQLGVID
jgi:DNA-binding CsgD family transcriptional regulator